MFKTGKYTINLKYYFVQFKMLRKNVLRSPILGIEHKIKIDYFLEAYFQVLALLEIV
jgi:hypothetical protein